MFKITNKFGQTTYKVNINGKINFIKASEILSNNEKIIEDNCVFGVKTQIDEQEINRYYINEIKKLKQLMYEMKHDSSIELYYDSTTHMYIIAHSEI